MSEKKATDIQFPDYVQDALEIAIKEVEKDQGFAVTPEQRKILREKYESRVRYGEVSYLTMLIEQTLMNAIGTTQEYVTSTVPRLELFTVAVVDLLIEKGIITEEEVRHRAEIVQAKRLIAMDEARKKK